MAPEGTCDTLINTLATIDFNVYKLGSYWYSMRVILFLRIMNTDICSPHVHATGDNIPPVAVKVLQNK